MPDEPSMNDLLRSALPGADLAGAERRAAEAAAADLPRGPGQIDGGARPAPPPPPPSMNELLRQGLQEHRDRHPQTIPSITIFKEKKS